jgi:hypothetical protein
MLTVQGDNNGIADFERALHYKLPQVEVIGYKPADSPLGDVTLELEFRPPVLVEHAIRAVDVTAIETGIAPSTLTYSHFEP